MLTVSAAPVTARQRKVRRNEWDKPNTIVAAPYAHTAQSSTTPRRSILSIDRTMTTLISTAPTDGAAYSHPYPLAPTRRMSCAKIGSRAVADEKNVAKKSSSIVERIIGEEKTKPKPSRTARTLKSLVSSALRVGTSRIMRSATITHTNVSALTAYTHSTPSVAMMTPPIAGPATDATWTMIAFRLMAFGR